MTDNTTIAFVTDDGSTICPHFGRARYYEIITLKAGQVDNRERIPKAGHHTFGRGDQESHGADSHGQHSHDHQAQGHKHETMVAPILHCQFLVARGMGMGAHQHLTSAGITPILTDVHTIDEAVKGFLEGTLRDNPRRLHDHGPGHQH